MKQSATAPVKAKVTSFVILVAIIAAIGGLPFGYDTGVISGVILGGVFADRCDRRWSIIGGAVAFITGTLIATFAPDEFVLTIGRIIVGMAIGVASFIVPMYISEMAPPRTRGVMTSLNQIALTLGILVAYGVDYLYANGGLWRAMFAWGLVPSIILLVGMLFMPDSSRWLLSKHREQQAHDVLQKVRGTADVEDEIQETTDEIQAEKGGGLAVLKTSPLRMPLIIGVGLTILQQATGINTVIYYAPTIFHAAGFKSASSSIAATALIGAVNLVATIIAAFLVDRLRRCPLLLISLTGMVLGLLVLSMSFFLSHGTPTSFLSLLTVTSLMIYIAAFAVGIGPVFWLLISEIYPLNVLGTAMSLATVANWAANFLIAVTFLSFVKVLTEGGTFLLYAVIGVLAWIFAFRLVPETKGKTLEQIQQHWQAGKHPREMGKAAAPHNSP